VSRADAHLILGQMAIQWNDLALAAAESDASIAAAGEMTRAERADNVARTSNAYGALTEATRVRSGVEPAVAVTERAKPDLLSTREPGTPQYGMIQNWIEGYKSFFPFYDVKAPVVRAPHWFAENGDTTARPIAGVPTLIIFVDHGCGGRCYPMYATLRRTVARYGPRGLQVVLVGQTKGYFRKQLETDVAHEIAQIRRYYREFLRIPGLLAVQETQFSRIPDGRRMPEPAADARRWPQGVDMILVAKDGTFRSFTWSSNVTMSEIAFRAQLDAITK